MHNMVSGLTHGIAFFIIISAVRLKTHFRSLGTWVPQGLGHQQQSHQLVQPQHPYQYLQTSERAHQTSSKSYPTADMAKTSHDQTGVQQRMPAAQATSTGEVVPHQAQQTDAISEQRKRGHESTEDIPPAPQSAEKKPRKMKKAPGKAPARQSKRKAAEVKVADEGKKALDELEDAVNWTNDETRILLDALLGPDSELYKELGANSRYAYRKVSMKFKRQLLALTKHM
jgi:hypothetical protein